MFLDILTVLFFVLGFALISWMIVERRRDVLHGPYVTKLRTAREMKQSVLYRQNAENSMQMAETAQGKPAIIGSSEWQPHGLLSRGAGLA